jgi:transposase
MRRPDPRHGPRDRCGAYPWLRQKSCIVSFSRRQVVKRSFGWAARLRRLAQDYERFTQSLAGLHYVASVCLMLGKTVSLLAAGS